jgi:hypothetical protein
MHQKFYTHGHDLRDTSVAPFIQCNKHNVSNQQNERQCLQSSH